MFTFSSSVYKVSPYYTPIESVVGIDSKFLIWVVKVAEKFGQFDVLDNEVVKYVVQFKWEYARKWFLLDFALKTVFSLLFLTHSVVYHLYATLESSNVALLHLRLRPVGDHCFSQPLLPVL